MSVHKRFPFGSAGKSLRTRNLFPLLPIRLVSNRGALDLKALLDTGASVNVIPYDVGCKLGIKWSEAWDDFALSGTLADFPSRSIILTGEISGFEPVRLIFAWTKSNDVPVILGQTNFFLEFDVCFFREIKTFEVMQKKKDS